MSVVLGKQHAKRMRRIILSSVACPALPYFPHYNTNGTIFGKKVIEHKMSIFIFSRTSTRNISHPSRSPWPRGLRRGSASARLMRLWVEIPPVAWLFVCCERCVLSGRGFGFGLIIRPKDSYRLWCVVACDLETSRRRRPWPLLGHNATKKNLIPRRNERDIINVYWSSCKVLIIPVRF
jgi:hypothetical protein